MMALFKNKAPEKIGPIRSARHYFSYYAMEHNAIFTHYGWSPKAKSTITQYKVDNINGITSDTSAFWRIGSGYHNVFTSIKKLKDLSLSKKYLVESSKKPIYNYSTEEIELDSENLSKTVKLKYSNLHNVSYEYDEAKKIYYRYYRNQKDYDRETKEQYYAKNIIIIEANNYPLQDSENKGRQEVEIVGEGTGYFLTNGKYIEISWKKNTIDAKTSIYDKNKKEITLNDGITYFHVVPKDNVTLL